MKRDDYYLVAVDVAKETLCVLIAGRLFTSPN